MIFAKNAFLKFGNRYLLLPTIRNIVLKLFDDKCQTKACEILTQSFRCTDIQEVVFFHAAILSFFEGQNVNVKGWQLPKMQKYIPDLPLP